MVSFEIKQEMLETLQKRYDFNVHNLILILSYPGV